MSGPLALHGGGEFRPGDEPFLRRLLDLAALARADDARAIRVELVTSAVARHQPEATFEFAAVALRRVAREAEVERGLELDIDIGHARVVDAVSAADPEMTRRIAGSDLVYLPGGDPDAVIRILGGSAALRAIAAARARGAVVAGASAGAMAMGALTWTRDGYVPGFGWAGDVVVVPHAPEAGMAGRRGTAHDLPRGRELTILGLPERSGVIGRPGSWTVVGGAGAWAWAHDAAAPVHAADGAMIAVGPSRYREKA